MLPSNHEVFFSFKSSKQQNYYCPKCFVLLFKKPLTDEEYPWQGLVGLVPQIYILLSSFHQVKAERKPSRRSRSSGEVPEPHHTPQQLLAAACFSGTVTSNTFDLAPQLNLNGSPEREHITCQANTLRGWEALQPEKHAENTQESAQPPLICHKTTQWHSEWRGTNFCSPSTRTSPPVPAAPPSP